jgi:putative aminopeptidase FrvX
MCSMCPKFVINNSSTAPCKKLRASQSSISRGSGRHRVPKSLSSQNGLTDDALQIAAEVAIEMARDVTQSVNAHAKALTFARAALRDAKFKAALTAMHRSIILRRAIDPRNMLTPLAPLFRNIERAAEKVLSEPAS